MDDTSLKVFLTSNVDLDPSFIDEVLSNCKTMHVNKKDFLLQAGEYCKHSFYVEKGLLRYYSIDNKGKEHILQFAPERWFVGDRESTYFNRPSNYFIQALEDSNVVLVDERLITTLSNSNPSFTIFNNKLLHNHIRQLQHRINMLLSATAEERYLDFIEIYPDILLRVPQTFVASYLGITPESLSRVRKELAEKNFKG